MKSMTYPISSKLMKILFQPPHALKRMKTETSLRPLIFKWSWKQMMLRMKEKMTLSPLQQPLPSLPPFHWPDLQHTKSANTAKTNLTTFPCRRPTSASRIGCQVMDWVPPVPNPMGFCPRVNTNGDPRAKWATLAVFLMLYVCLFGIQKEWQSV